MGFIVQLISHDWSYRKLWREHAPATKLLNATACGKLQEGERLETRDEWQRGAASLTCGERNAQGQRQWTWQKELMSPASHTGDTPAWSPSLQSLGRVWWSKRCLVPWRLTIHNMYNVLLHIIIMYWYIICLSIFRRFRSKLQLSSPQQTGRKCASFVFTRIAQEFRSLQLTVDWSDFPSWPKIGQFTNTNSTEM